MPFAARWMDLEIIVLSQAEKDKFHKISHMWNLKNDTNDLFTKLK